MSYRIFLLIVIVLPMAVQAQHDKKSIQKGNELYRQQKYAEAEASYQQSLAGTQGSLEGNFNLGTAWYKQQKLEDAVKKFGDIAESSPDKAIKAKAYHNLGNALLESQKLEESIDAYKKSLMNNPKDDETRYNLAYAQEKLKQQDQDNKDNKDRDKDRKDQDEKDNKDNKDRIRTTKIRAKTTKIKKKTTGTKTRRIRTKAIKTNSNPSPANCPRPMPSGCWRP